MIKIYKLKATKNWQFNAYTYFGFRSLPGGKIYFAIIYFLDGNIIKVENKDLNQLDSKIRNRLDSKIGHNNYKFVKSKLSELKEHEKIINSLMKKAVRTIKLKNKKSS